MTADSLGERQLEILDLTGCYILSRHGNATVSFDDHLGPGIADQEAINAGLIADQLAAAQVDFECITSSELRRANETAEAQKADADSLIQSDPRLNEVKTVLPRPIIATLLFLGHVPKAHKEAGLLVLAALDAGQINGYSVTHNGVIAGMRRAIKEFPELSYVSYTIKKGQVVAEKPRTNIRRSLTMKNLAFIAVHNVE